MFIGSIGLIFNWFNSSINESVQLVQRFKRFNGSTVQLVQALMESRVQLDSSHQTKAEPELGTAQPQLFSLLLLLNHATLASQVSFANFFIFMDWIWQFHLFHMKDLIYEPFQILIVSVNYLQLQWFSPQKNCNIFSCG